MANVKNYAEQGGEKTIVGGQLEIAEGGKLTFGEVQLQPCESVVNSSATTIAGTVTDLNNLIAKLKSAGIMKSE